MSILWISSIWDFILCWWFFLFLELHVTNLLSSCVCVYLAELRDGGDGVGAVHCHTAESKLLLLLLTHSKFFNSLCLAFLCVIQCKTYFCLISCLQLNMQALRIHASFSILQIVWKLSCSLSSFVAFYKLFVLLFIMCKSKVQGV